MATVDANAALAAARRLAEEVLLPAATSTDAADLLPDAHLDALAEAGLYGITGPASAGGSDLDLATASRVIEILAGGCLTTAFVWTQHHSPVRAVAHAPNADLRDRWLAPMCAGRARAGVALGGLFGAVPMLHAQPTTTGWLLDGESPWVTGWGRVDVLHVAARDGDDVVWALVDAKAAPGLSVRPLDLVAVNASGTVTLRMDGYAVPADRVVAIEPYTDVLARDATGMRRNGSLALGVVGRCCALLGPGPLDAELDAARTALDTAPPHAMPAARADAAELALRAAAALVVGRGSRSVLAGQHAERLARESLFLLVFGSRPPIRTALLRRLGATAD
jgi:alkylation response protein AidB-like acyl-CoA dehydrogenase